METTTHLEKTSLGDSGSGHQVQEPGKRVPGLSPSRASAGVTCTSSSTEERQKHHACPSAPSPLPGVLAFTLKSFCEGLTGKDVK